MIKTLAKTKLADFIYGLKRSWSVYLPLPNNSGDFVFQSASDTDIKNVKLDQPNTLFPPTRLFFPLQEELMEIKNNQYIAKKNTEKIAVVGVQATDIKAINRLDIILANDSFYQAKRKNSLIIGIQDLIPNNIYDQVLSSEALKGYDLFLEEQGSEYLVMPGSDKGERLLKNPIFEQETGSFKENDQKTNTGLNLKKIAWAIEKTKNGKVWQKYADICMGCGNCTYVCPLCFCYEMKDKIDLSGKITRNRTQSTCFSADFNHMANGLNPKKQFINRFYNWYYHKFVQMPKEFGFSGCVNCGRCIKACPANINFREVLNEVMEEAENGE